MFVQIKKLLFQFSIFIFWLSCCSLFAFASPDGRNANQALSENQNKAQGKVESSIQQKEESLPQSASKEKGVPQQAEEGPTQSASKEKEVPQQAEESLPQSASKEKGVPQQAEESLPQSVSKEKEVPQQTEETMEEASLPDWDKDIPASLEINTDKIRPSGKTVFKMKTFSDDPSSYAIFSTEFYGRLRWQVLESLSFYNQAVLIGRSGFTQSRYDRGDRKNGLHLIESYFDIEISSFQIRIGNIKQDFLQAPLLVTDKTFPSLFEKVSFKVDENIKLSLLFQQAVMDNSVESFNREAQKIRGFPVFLTSSLFLDWENFMETNIEEKLTFFYMYNLSPALADRSNILGNTVNYYDSDSRFKYNFFGFYNKLAIYKKLSDKWIWSLGGDIIYNFLAPDAFNQGERFYSSLYYNYQDIIEFKFTGEYFANQSDTSVAYYNSELYGHNNRIGGLASLTAHFYKSGMTLSLSYIGSDAINGGHKTATGFASTVALVLMSNYMSVF